MRCTKMDGVRTGYLLRVATCYTLLQRVATWCNMPHRFGIMTNEPPFPFHIANVKHFQWKRTLARPAVATPGAVTCSRPQATRCNTEQQVSTRHNAWQLAFATRAPERVWVRFSAARMPLGYSGTHSNTQFYPDERFLRIHTLKSGMATPRDYQEALMQAAHILNSGTARRACCAPA